MSESLKTIHTIQEGLHPFVKPREQANYIRRILALHLGYSSQGGPLSLPLALETRLHEPSQRDANTNGLQAEYLDALSTNVAARRQFEDAARTVHLNREGALRPRVVNSNILADRVALLKLQQRRQRLSSIQKYLDLLAEQPAALHTFFDENQIFEGTTSLPQIPREIVNSFVEGGNVTKRDLASQVNQLEKTVLRAKIQLQQEGTKLEEVRTQKDKIHGNSSDAAKYDALNTTRTELIAWIERELSMVSSDEPTERPDETGERSGYKPDPAAIKATLGDIKQKYDRYVSMRSDLLSLMSLQPHSLAAPPELKPNPGTQFSEVTPPPSNYLFTPYIKRLLEVSRAQRFTISHKSHINTSLGKQTKDASHALAHLAEESQLLPAHPMKDSLRRRSGLIDEFRTNRSEAPDLSRRVGPWIFAADSAKIASLESVAETVETGQLAIENSMASLDEIKRLVGLDQDQARGPQSESFTEGDMWLSPQKSRDTSARKRTEQRDKRDKTPGDIWSVLHGNLGLIGQEDLA